MRLWQLLLVAAICMLVIGLPLAHLADNSQVDWDRYSHDHHCKETKNYFNLVHVYDCDGQQVWR